MPIDNVANMLIEADPSEIMEYALLKTPDEWQRRLLRDRPRQSLLLCSRQSGKSTTSAALVLHQAVYQKNSLVLIISKALRQAEELFRVVKYGAGKILDKHDIIRENQSTMELSNGSRIISLPGKEDSIRSFSSVALLVIDEAAQVADELYATIRPMLAVSKGKIIALTTPYGKRGWFFRAWQSESTEWYKIQVTATDCPRITEEFLENERNELGEWWVKQEYFCEFVETEDQIFTYDMVKAMMKPELECWDVL